MTWGIAGVRWWGMAEAVRLVVLATTLSRTESADQSQDCTVRVSVRVDATC